MQLLSLAGNELPERFEQPDCLEYQRLLHLVIMGVNHEGGQHRERGSSGANKVLQHN